MIELNESNFEESTNEGLVLVDFYAPWCGPCRALAPTLAQVNNVKVVKVNTDESYNLAVKYRVSSLPTLVFLKEGNEVGRMIGLQSKTAVQNKIDELNEV